MITEEKLRIYKRYNGDINGFSRGKHTPDEEIMDDRDWFEIDELLQRLSIEKAGFAADSFRFDTAQLVALRVSSSVAATLLREMA